MPEHRGRNNHHKAAPVRSGKRQREDSPSPVRDRPSKTHKGPASEEFFDAYMWDVNLAKGSPMTAARRAAKELGMNPEVVLSAIHLRDKPKGLISIRFVDNDSRQMFMDRLRTNPPRDMTKLKVCTPAAYGQRRDESVRRDEHNFW